MGKILEEMLKKQEESKSEKFEKKSIYDVKNYLNLKLSKTETEKTVKVRLLSIDAESDSPNAEIYGHWFGKNYICTKKSKNLPEKTDRRCPFCEMEEDARAEQKTCPHTPKWDKLKDIIKKNTAQQAHVVRVIERGDEGFGPKFWKMGKTHYESIEFLIKKVYTEEGIDVFDYKDGIDLEISLKKDDKGDSAINTITLARRQTPLSTDESQIEKWVNDEKKWIDVFTVKSYEYLSVIIGGGDPWFSKELNKWVDKKELEKKELEKKQESTPTEEEVDDEDEDGEYTNFHEGTEDTLEDEDGKKEEEEDLPF
jgi:hypothetical protein